MFQRILEKGGFIYWKLHYELKANDKFLGHYKMSKIERKKNTADPIIFMFFWQSVSVQDSYLFIKTIMQWIWNHFIDNFQPNLKFSTFSCGQKQNFFKNTYRRQHKIKRVWKTRQARHQKGNKYEAKRDLEVDHTHFSVFQAMLL